MPRKKIIKRNRPYWILSVVCFVFCGIILTRSFFPVLKEEIEYDLKSKKEVKTFDSTPIDTSFSILIPKLWINSRVITAVDADDPKIYEKALSLGVAHAKQSSLPNQKGNVFLFAHSATNWYEANNYNAVFYLLYKLNQGDEIELFYLGKSYKYKVVGKKYVDSQQIEFLQKNTDVNKLTLMTCWPPGTSLKRLIVEAELL